MTQTTLNEEDRKEVVKYRLEKAQVTYKDALLGISNDSGGIAENRRYYASYCAVSALLISYGIVVRPHDGVERMPSLRFLKKQLTKHELWTDFQHIPYV